MAKTLSQHAMLTYDDIESNGPPSHSLKFPSATVRRAVWVSGLIHDTKADNITSSSHILLSTRGRSINNNHSVPEQAYWVRRKLSETSHGCIRLCVVLVRKRRNKIRNLLIPTAAEPDEFARPGWSYGKENELKYVQSKNAVPDRKIDNSEWVWQVTGDLVAVKMVRY